MEIKKIATIKTDFPSKFGIPRQSRRIKELTGEIIFEKEYSNKDYIKGLQEYSHIWIIWGFSKSKKSGGATVRPPRLGGNKKVGVFATRAPFRPNNLALSCVELLDIYEAKGITALKIGGADMMNGSPVYDIKPYMPYTDCVPDAKYGFAEKEQYHSLQVEFSDFILPGISEEDKKIITAILKEDPRPAYHKDENRVYGFKYGKFEIKFKVSGNNLTVTEIIT
ncbi:MAG: tRNA (N6-threonylcarbamoyladenosine(37)-N6)-methyltransferase TrmO [Clostridiales bacterium]|nr:tRNA (N6-threonylcarbamoyladenosine(37)-N6)-methyltransferase TrmO [Clostridiales bacterium]